MHEPAPDPPMPRWLVVSTAAFALAATFFFSSHTLPILLGLSLALLAYVFLMVLVVYPLWMGTQFVLGLFRPTCCAEKVIVM